MMLMTSEKWGWHHLEGVVSFPVNDYGQETDEKCSNQKVAPKFCEI
jgi:hypothetical protein